MGADFLDPLHHEAATGRPACNLDGWMLDKAQVLASFRRHTLGCDVAIVEGVMGLFDGRDGRTEDGSTAQVRILGPGFGFRHICQTGANQAEEQPVLLVLFDGRDGHTEDGSTAQVRNLGEHDGASFGCKARFQTGSEGLEWLVAEQAERAPFSGRSLLGGMGAPRMAALPR